MRSVILCVFVAVGSLVLVCGAVDARPTPLGTAFTYQGLLKQGGTAANGAADFQFTLWDALSGGVQVGGRVAANGVAVAGGNFTAAIDFGAVAFNGDARWLEIAVRSPAGGGAYTTLAPRQPLSPSPSSLATRGIIMDSNGNAGLGGPPHGLGGFSGLPRLTLVQSNFLSPVLQLDGTGFSGEGASIVFGNDMGIVRCDDFAKMTINTGRLALTGGPVGIGTSTPGEMLTVAGSVEVGTNTADYQHLRIGGGNSSGYLYGAYATLGDGIHLGYNYHADFGSSIPNTGGSTSRISVGYGYVSLATGGVNAVPVDRMYVGPTGLVGIGTSSPGFMLHVNGTAGKPGGGSWSVASDVRLKKNIEPLRGSLDQLLSLRGVRFEYKDPKAIDELPGQRIGMIAQEVEQVFPDWVSERADGYRSVTYRGFEALTVEALRDLRAEKDAQIETLRAERDAQIEALRVENRALQDQMAELRAVVSQLSHHQSDHKEK